MASELGAFSAHLCSPEGGPQGAWKGCGVAEDRGGRRQDAGLTSDSGRSGVESWRPLEPRDMPRPSAAEPT
jgi:hypothetical protein